MPDYNTLIDAETWAFIKCTAEAYPNDAVDKSIATQRDAYDAMCRVFNTGRPKGIIATDHYASGVPVRHYTNVKQVDGPLVLYIHGGGFVVGGLNSHDDVCAEICAMTGFEVIAVDYRLSPEYVHPAAFNDAMTALQWIREEFGKSLILVGDSAGGNLCAAVAQASRGDVDILGQVLIYPGLGGDRSKGSYLIHANAPMLTLAEVQFYETIYSGGPSPVGDASFAPLHDRVFTGLPPTLTISAECDPLCDDGQNYCTQITMAGGTAIAIVEPGLVHGYLRARHCVMRARNSFARINRAIKVLGNAQPLTLQAVSD